MIALAIIGVGSALVVLLLHRSGDGDDGEPPTLNTRGDDR